MKAIVYTEYGSPDVLHIEEIAQPVPQDNEVCVRIYATPVNFGDLLARNMRAVTPATFTMPLPFWLPTRLMFGFNKPKVNILGSEFAGVVDSVGSAVTQYQPGDAVFGYRGPKMGANAEYLCVPENSLIAPMPNHFSFAEAAALPYGALTALNILRKADIQSGQKVLINGASGSIGSFALQFARLYGAEVTAVCGTARMAQVEALGADHVIDYSREDFTQGSARYDLIVDILGKTGFGRSKKVLNPGGRYLLASFKTGHLLQMLWTSLTGGKRVICALSSEKPDDLLHIRELAEAGLLRAVIDRSFPMEEAAAAHRHIESGRRTGSVLIAMADETTFEAPVPAVVLERSQV